MSEEVSLESLARQLPSKEEWQRAVSDAAAAIDAVRASIAEAARDLAEYLRSISPVMACILCQNAITAHRRRQHARRALAKASRRARSGRPRGAGA